MGVMKIMVKPDRTSDAGTYLLLGEPPLTAEIHKRILCTFASICRNFDTVEHQITWRQLSVKIKGSHSWFMLVKDILQQYSLPTAFDILEEPPGKYSWKNTVNKIINTCWEEKLKLETSSKTSLKYLNAENATIGKIHSIWNYAGSEPISVTKAHIKCKLILGVYTLQSTKHKFNQYEIKPSCPLCYTGDEDRLHFILICEKLEETRQSYVKKIKNILTVIHELKSNSGNILDSQENLLKLILDCNAFISIPEAYRRKIENISRGLYYALHVARSNLLASL